jgi:hypothetical protein
MQTSQKSTLMQTFPHEYYVSQSALTKLEYELESANLRFSSVYIVQVNLVGKYLASTGLQSTPQTTKTPSFLSSAKAVELR